tara:strand:+ start:628 stop:741 length:114 start_codon:yes stop_codon:yes gene_type:complete
MPKKPYPSWVLNETTCGWVHISYNKKGNNRKQLAGIW